MLAIIGGTGLTRLSTLAVAHREVVRTPYGEPSAALIFGQLEGRDAVFLARHGHGHTIPPHRVNYRANLWALKQRGASSIVAVASVGAICRCGPGDLVVPNQLVDYTAGREQTYFDGSDHRVVHVDFTEPYSAQIRQRLLAAANAANLRIVDGGVYMTGMPEAALARELNMPYAAVCVVVNHAAGRGDSAKEISMERIAQVLETAMDRVHILLKHLAPLA